MGELKGFQDPPHILKMREEQAKERERKKTSYIDVSTQIDAKPCRKKSKKIEEKKVTELSDEDAGAFADLPKKVE